MIAAQSFGCQEQMGLHPNEFPESWESVAKVKIKCQGNSFSADTENGVEMGSGMGRKNQESNNNE